MGKREKLHTKIENAKIDATQSIKNIPNYEKLRLTTPITVKVGVFLENNIPKSANIDKRLMLIEILSDVYPSLTPNEIEVINEQITDSLSNGKIKATPLIKRIGKLLFNFFLNFLI